MCVCLHIFKQLRFSIVHMLIINLIALKVTIRTFTHCMREIHKPFQVSFGSILYFLYNELPIVLLIDVRNGLEDAMHYTCIMINQYSCLKVRHFCNANFTYFGECFTDYLTPRNAPHIFFMTQEPSCVFIYNAIQKMSHEFGNVHMSIMTFIFGFSSC